MAGGEHELVSVRHLERERGWGEGGVAMVLAKQTLLVAEVVDR